VLVEEVVLLFEVFSAHSMSWATNVFHYLSLFLCWTEVMNISEGTVVTALKVGRPRKTPLPAPGEDGSGAGGAGPVSGVYTDGVSAQHKRPKLY
jgi:hypothetical protein